MALSSDRNTPERGGVDYTFPAAGLTTIYGGAIVCLKSDGYATKGAAATGLVAVGRAEERVVNAGADGAETIRVRRGIFRYANSAAADAIAAAQIGQVCYIVDDQTVAKTDGGGTRSPAGIVHDVDVLGVWVQIGYGPVAATGALLAANNLSDLADAATARAALGVAKVFVTVAAADLIAANAAVYRFVAPSPGTITQLRSVLGAALAAGDATLTAKINGVAVTSGVITIANVGSAAGVVDSATPSAANAIAVGDVVSLTVGGANTAAAGADVIVEITL